MKGKLAGLRQVAESAFREALLAADPEEAVHRYFRLKGDVLRVGDIDYFLSRFDRIFVFGAGKASLRMALAVERILGDRVANGLIICGRGSGGSLRRLLVREASHPLPDEDGVSATEELLEMADPLTDQDLVIFLVSGGGSAMLTAPPPGVSVPDLQRATRLFLHSGMTIHEINTVRKHLCRVKGGRLAARISPATIITLILSDVIGDRLDLIASGPTAPDPSGYPEAIASLERRGLWEQMPDSIREALLAGRAGRVPETPKPDSPVFKRVHHRIVGSNRMSLLAAQARAKRMGMNTILLSSSVCGESREIAQFYAALAREIRNFDQPVKAPACLIAGGETTVKVNGDGRGGRCQEMALAIARTIAEIPGTVFLAAGTDGVDGVTDAAGGIADSSTLERALAKGLDLERSLARNDAYPALRELGDLVKTGPTGTNVMDVHILLVG